MGDAIYTSNVTELPVLENEEPFPPRDVAEPLDCAVAEVVDDVGVCFEHAYRVAYFLCYGQELGGRGDVSG